MAIFPLRNFLLVALACACATGGQPASAQPRTMRARAQSAISPAPAPPPEKWLHVKSEHFDMLSCSSARKSRELLIHLEQFRAAFFDLFNLGRVHQEKLTVVLFDNARQYFTYHPHMNCSGFFTRTPLENFMVLSTENPEGSFRTIIHEYVHAIVSNHFKGVPLCFNEGLSTFFEATQINGDTVRVGDVNNARLGLLRRLHKMLPIAALLDPAKARTTYQQAETRPMFYAQSWLFAHYLIAGSHTGPKADAIDKFMALSKNKKLSLGQAFEGSFGVSMDEMEKNLKRYLRDGRFGRLAMTVQPKPIADKITVNPAGKLDVEYMLDTLLNGTCKCMLGNLDDDTQAAIQRLVKTSSEPWADKAPAANPDHVAPHHRLATIGLTKRNAGQAIKHLRKAVDLGSDNAKAHLTLAALLSPKHLDAMPPGDCLPAGLTAELRRLLDKAIALDPDYIEAHEARLVVESRCEEMRPGVIKEAVAAIGSRHDRRPVVMTALALMAWRNKDHAASRRLVDALLPDLPPPLPAQTAAGKKRPPLKDASQSPPAPPTRATAPSRAVLPLDFSNFRYAVTVRNLDRLLASHAQAITQAP